MLFRQKIGNDQKIEVDYLMKLPEEFLDAFLTRADGRKRSGTHDRRNKNGFLRIREERLKKPWKNGRQYGFILNFALNYGRRAEMVHACKDDRKDSQKGKINIQKK